MMSSRRNNPRRVMVACLLASAGAVAATLGMFPMCSYAADTLVVAADGTGSFRSVQDAVDAADSSGTVILVRAGRYREKLFVPESKKNLMLVGEDAAAVVLTFDDHAGKPAGSDTIRTGTSYSVRIAADGVTAEGVTFENASGPVGQAVAVMVDGDRIVFRRCRLAGFQDTFYLRGTGRVFLTDCRIEGTTDYIFGSSVALFEDCVIHSRKKSYITAASTPEGRRYGLVFRRCRLTADPGIDSVYLGRPWRPFARTVFIACAFGTHIHPAGWHNWRKPDAERTVFYAEFRCTGPGADRSARVPWSQTLDELSAGRYTTANIFSADPGGPGFAEDWDPYRVGSTTRDSNVAPVNH